MQETYQGTGPGVLSCTVRLMYSFVNTTYDIIKVFIVVTTLSSCQIKKLKPSNSTP
jgi:hypothetical protein